MPTTFEKLIRADASREQIEEWCRSQTQSYSVVTRGIGEVVARVLGKYLMGMPAQDIAIAPHLVLDGIWEPWVTMAIARHLQPGMMCMDVGACYGYYSILMADLVGSAGKVEAWEPQWGGICTTNTRLNGLEVEVVKCAMGSTKKQVRMRPPGGYTTGTGFNAGGFSVYDSGSIAPGKKVEMRAPEAHVWDFIKIDVEGAEADVWKALADVRKVSPALTVCLEFTPEMHTAPALFLLDIVNDGFRLGTVGHDGVPRECSMEEALCPDTGNFRMLWLTRGT
jgi:FkbM family methyltransferase